MSNKQVNKSTVILGKVQYIICKSGGDCFQICNVDKH